MKRRIFLSLASSLLLSRKALAAQGQSQVWSAEFMLGAFDGVAHQAGLRIKLDAGWKTYWRNPGSAGIPPDIQISGINVASTQFDFPLPIRIIDEGGEAFGYHDEVVFPITITPVDSAKPIAPHINAFFGVCATVCTPAKFASDAIAGVLQAKQIAEWSERVPKVQKFVSSATLEGQILKLDLLQPVNDIFVEGLDRFYFAAPDLTSQPGMALIAIKGLKNENDVRGHELRLTADKAGLGLEQRITVA